jgi:hypothetical protein
MAILLPHIEDTNTTTLIPPKGDYEPFLDENDYLEKIKEWGLSAKKEFWYKDKTHQRLVTIKGYEIYGKTSEYYTLIIEFQDGNLSCISPAYLKEMQSSNFGKESIFQDVSSSVEASITESKPEVEADQDTISETIIHTEVVSDNPPAVKVAKPKKEKKEKPSKLVLPEEKVHFTGKVKQFALSWNHFNEENDEVIVLEDVRIEQEEPIDVGLAWCAHSKTMKKFELTPGQTLEFDGKIVKKSLPKGKDVEDEDLKLDVTVSYKINNPSKIVKK